MKIKIFIIYLVFFNVYLNKAISRKLILKKCISKVSKLSPSEKEEKF